MATSLSLSGSALGFPYVVNEILDDCQYEYEERQKLKEQQEEEQKDIADDVGEAMRKCAAIVSSHAIPLLPNERAGTTFSFQVRIHSCV